jgi:hypothetical protein
MSDREESDYTRVAEPPEAGPAPRPDAPMLEVPGTYPTALRGPPEPYLLDPADLSEVHPDEFRPNDRTRRRRVRTDVQARPSHHRRPSYDPARDPDIEYPAPPVY